MSAVVRWKIRVEHNQDSRYFEPREVIEMVATIYRVTPRDITGHKRENHSVRQIAYLATMVFTCVSIAEIGRAFERDHKTIMHGIKATERLLKRDAAFQAEWMIARDSILSGNIEPAYGEPQQASLIKPLVILPDDHPLTDNRRACHRMSVAYGRALFREHGKGAAWC